MSAEDIPLDVLKNLYGGRVINCNTVTAVFSEGLITDLGNQTFFKNEDGTPASLIDVAERKKDTKLMKLLLNHRVIPDVSELLGRPLLLWIMDDDDLYQDISLIKKLLDDGQNIDCRKTKGEDGDYLTPLLRAVERGNVDVVKFLLENGSSINPPCLGINSCFGCSPLSFAIREEHHELIDLLLKCGADINQQCKSYGTPLHYACWYSDAQIVQRLLDGGANINDIYPEEGRTTADIAVEQGNSEVLKILLDNHGIDLNTLNFMSDSSIVHDVITSNALNCINILLDGNPDVNLVDYADHLAIEVIDDYVVKTGECLKRHIVRLRAAGFYLHERNVEAVSGEDYANLYTECCQQVEAMKASKISPTSHLSVYDSLFLTQKKLALCLESLDDPEIMESGFYKKFPLYSGMLEFMFKKAYQYIELRDVVRTSAYNLFNNYLPATILEQIFTYFSFEDLVELWKDLKKKDSGTSDKNE